MRITKRFYRPQMRDHNLAILETTIDTARAEIILNNNAK